MVSDFGCRDLINKGLPRVIPEVAHVRGVLVEGEWLQRHTRPRLRGQPLQWIQPWCWVEGVSITLLSMLHTYVQCHGRSSPSSPPSLTTYRVQGSGFRVYGRGLRVWGEGSGCGSAFRPSAPSFSQTNSSHQCLESRHPICTANPGLQPEKTRVLRS